MMNAKRLVMVAICGLMNLSAVVCLAEGAENLARLVWRPAEFTFTAQGMYERPWEQVELSAVFKGPDGTSYRVNGFWDGGRTWKIRFAPTAPGVWTATTSCNTADAGLAGLKVTFTAQPAAGENPLHQHGGILRVGADSRHLTYSDGTPFFWLGDTWWFCPSDLVPIDGSTKADVPSMYKTLIDKRRAQGFTVVQMAFLGSRGVNSFMSLRQESTLDVAYWQQVDRYMDYANAAGIVPVIGMAFHVGMDKNSLDDWKFLWRYVVARYGAHAVTWLICGEYNHDGGDQAGRVDKTMALGAYIKEQDPYKRAMTVHPWWYERDERQAWNQPWYDFIMIQGAHVGPGNVPPTSIYRGAWKHQPPRPVLEAECNYEGIRECTPDDVRRVAYHAIQAGSFGFTYGAHGLWYPTQNAEDKRFDDWGRPMVWWESMERLGAAQMSHLRKCYESVQWWKLAPRPDAVEFSGKVSDATRPLVKSEGDRVHLVWFPKGSGAKTPATLKLADAAGGGIFSATWFNLRDGRETKLTAALTAANGKCSLPERLDEEDWMLILKRVSDYYFALEEVERLADARVFELKLADTHHLQAPLNLQITAASDNGEAWQIEISSNELTVKPGEEKPIRITVMVDSKKPRYPLPKVIITASTVRDGETLQASAGRYLEVVGEQPPLHIPRIEATPVINGDLNDSAWQREPDVPMLGRMDMGRKIEPSTSVWAAYDEEKLYVAFRCMEPDTGSLVLNAVERDDNLWEDDSVEVLFDPDGEGKTYYHIIVNAAGVIYDGRGFDKSFDIEGLKVAANIDDDNWTAEIAIPWRSLGIEVMPVGSTMLFVRSRHVTGSDEIFQFPLSPGGNHQPRYFAKLTFGGPGGAHTIPANDR